MNTLTVALFMFMALLIGNKIGHDAGSAVVCKVTHDQK